MNQKNREIQLYINRVCRMPLIEAYRNYSSIIPTILINDQMHRDIEHNSKTSK